MTQLDIYDIFSGKQTADLYVHLLTQLPVPLDGSKPLSEPTYKGYSPCPFSVASRQGYDDVGMAVIVGSATFWNWSGGPVTGLIGYAISLKQSDGTYSAIFAQQFPASPTFPMGLQLVKVQASIQLYNGPR